jgi:hypothetical protein
MEHPFLYRLVSQPSYASFIAPRLIVGTDRFPTDSRRRARFHKPPLVYPRIQKLPPC